MTGGWRGYRAVVRASLQVGVVYRLGFFFTVLGNLIFLALTYHLWRAVYGDRTVLNGLTFDQAYLYVALGSTMFVLLKVYSDWDVAWDIRDGMIDVRMARPLDLQGFYLADAFGRMLMNLAAVTLPALLLVFGVYRIDVPAGPGVWLLPPAFLLAFVISFCFDWIVGMLAFTTESVWGLSIVKESLLIALSGALVPLAFFPGPIDRLLELLPFAAVFHAPVGMLAEADAGWGTLLGRLGLQVVWLVALWAATRLAAARALRDVRVAGG